MTSRNVSRRLERLEGLILPSGGPDLITVNWVTTDGEVVMTEVADIGRRTSDREDCRNQPGAKPNAD